MMGHIDLKFIRFHFFPAFFRIGFGISLTTPLLKKRHDDKKCYRFLCFNVNIINLAIDVFIPLWVEHNEP